VNRRQQMALTLSDTGTETGTEVDPVIQCERGIVFAPPWPWLRRIIHLRISWECREAATWDEVFTCPDGTSHISHSCTPCHQDLLGDMGVAICDRHGMMHERKLVTSYPRGGAR